MPKDAVACDIARSGRTFAWHWCPRAFFQCASEACGNTVAEIDINSFANARKETHMKSVARRWMKLKTAIKAGKWVSSGI